MRRAALIGVLTCAALAIPAAAVAQHGEDSGPLVQITLTTYDPPNLTVIKGDTVNWENGSVRQHTVTADDGTFDSGIIPIGGKYHLAFQTAGSFPYFCRLHPNIRGTVTVANLLLDAQPLPAAPNHPFPLSGRAAPGLGDSVDIQADTGAGFQSVATAPLGDDGSFLATVTPTTTAHYRAVIGDNQSAPIELVVLDRQVATKVSRSGGRWRVTATVTPASPGATVVLQLKLRERFGFWPVARAKLNSRSQAVLSTGERRKVPARVVLTLPDGATALGFSKTVSLG